MTTWMVKGVWGYAPAKFGTLDYTAILTKLWLFKKKMWVTEWVMTYWLSNIPSFMLHPCRVRQKMHFVFLHLGFRPPTGNKLVFAGPWGQCQSVRVNYSVTHTLVLHLCNSLCMATFTWSPKLGRGIALGPLHPVGYGHFNVILGSTRLVFYNKAQINPRHLRKFSPHSKVNNCLGVPFNLP